MKLAVRIFHLLAATSSKYFSFTTELCKNIILAQSETWFINVNDKPNLNATTLK